MLAKRRGGLFAQTLRFGVLRSGTEGINSRFEQREFCADRAHIPLDFAAEQSVSVVLKKDDAMTPEPAKAEIADVIRKIQARLEQAAAVARLAEACINAGSAAKALTVMLDAEQPIDEVTTYLNARLINRAQY